jgi:hypothetical protein
MKVARVLLAVWAVSTAILLEPMTGPASPSTSWEDVVASGSVFRDESDVALTEWALGRFEQAGLESPEAVLAFHDEKTACEGHTGYFHPGSPHQIDICGFNWDRFLVTPRKVILHELGHAWAHDNLDEMTRREFLALRGLDLWQSGEAPWGEQGQEHAAEIMAWGLIDEDISMTSIGGSDPKQLAEAYELLTSS